MSEPIEKKAEALVALCNSMPRTPSKEQFIELLLRFAQMPDMRVVPTQQGVTFVVGDFDDLRAVGIVKT